MMIDNSIMALGSSPSITIDRSRCLRMRYDGNACDICLANCPNGAITADDEITIDEAGCSQCMVCVSECPTDCFDSEGADFFGKIAQLRKIQEMGLKPVFGCRSAPGSAHAAVSCLGTLSEVHLIAISIAMTGSVQLNMTCCSGCRNAFVVDALEKRIMDIRNNTGIDVSERVVLVKDGAGLQFEAEAYDRRGFFRAMKNMTFLGASGLLNETKDRPAPAYSKKMLPLKRDILNRTLRAAFGKGISERLIMEYGFTLMTGASCDSCFSCIGICPTGALKSSRNDSGDLLMYNSSACIGCGLCRDFCPQHSIEILKGHKKESYFEYEVCNESLCRTEKTEEAVCEDAVSV